MAKSREVQTVIKDGQTPMPLEILEEHIKKVSDFGKQIAASRLTQRTIVLLIQDQTGVTRADIERVLYALPNLEAKYLKPKRI